jgi:hypothetical protein
MEQARLLIINGESEWMWKAAVVTSFKVPTQYSHGVTEKNYATPSGYPVSGQDSSGTLLRVRKMPHKNLGPYTG